MRCILFHFLKLFLWIGNYLTRFHLQKSHHIWLCEKCFNFWRILKNPGALKISPYHLVLHSPEPLSTGAFWLVQRYFFCSDFDWIATPLFKISDSHNAREPTRLLRAVASCPPTQLKGMRPDWQLNFMTGDIPLMGLPSTDLPTAFSAVGFLTPHSFLGCCWPEEGGELPDGFYPRSLVDLPCAFDPWLWNDQKEGTDGQKSGG